MAFQESEKNEFTNYAFIIKEKKSYSYLDFLMLHIIQYEYF